MCVCVWKRHMLTVYFQVQLEEPPRVSSIVLYYLQGCIAKVHPKTFMERMFSHCECNNSQYTYQHKYPFVSTLCNKNLVPTDHLTHYFFHLLHIFSNLSTTMLSSFNLQNIDFKPKTSSILWCDFQSLEIICHIHPLVSLETIYLFKFPLRDIL